ncbi:MAG: LacI family DNA-binding transcriptional regulator [Chloroflexota bacterium]|nr:LacI family DNA-binding transcriptional regulator [Chloroflexota bacterium]
MAVTLRDIADRLGVSVATVSRALGGYSDTASDTRKRVLKAAEEMGYRPNIIARRLQQQRTDTIGFVIPTHGPRFSDPFFSELLAGIGNAAAEQDYDLLVSTRAPGDEELEVYERMVLEQRVDGMLVVRTRHEDQRVASLIKQNFPFVAFGRSDLEADFPYLDVDGRTGLRQLTQHLIDLGHRHIAYISAPMNLMFASHRLAGYKEALVANGIPFDEGLATVGELTERSGHRAGRDLLTRAPHPTAIIACNDLMALGTISAAQRLGLIVGRDLAVAGFDDIPLAEHAHPPLTTVRQPIYEIGQRICEMLIHLLREEPLDERHVILEPELVVRESSDGVVR